MTPADIHTGVRYDLAALDGTQACIFGCTCLGDHLPGCACHETCPDHEGHCTGCAPRPAHEASWLCGGCFHRKLRRPLRRVPAIVDWLDSRKAGLRAQAYDGPLVSTSKTRPLPFNPEIVDFLTLASQVVNAWADRVAREMPPGSGAPKGAAEGAMWLEARADWISEQRWVPDLVGHLAEIQRRSKALAPWAATRHSLPMPCLRCENQTLVLFGGEDWVTCVHDGCDNVISWSRYDRLSKAIAAIRASEVG